MGLRYVDDHRVQRGSAVQPSQAGANKPGTLQFFLIMRNLIQSRNLKKKSKLLHIPHSISNID